MLIAGLLSPAPAEIVRPSRQFTMKTS